MPDMPLRNRFARQLAGWRCIWRQKVLRIKLRPGILILGSPHSGTSLLAAMLDSHRMLATFPMETGLFFRGKKKFPGTIQALERLAHGRGAWRWVEKTPDHLLHMAAVRELMPEALVLLTVRDGRDVVASLKARFGDFRQALDTWKSAAEATVRYQHEPWLHLVRYEELAKDPVRVLTGVSDYIGEPFDRRMLDFHRRKRFWYAPTLEKPADASAPNHPAYRNWQINQPLFSGEGRWRRDLSAEEKCIVCSEGADLLEALGYTPDGEDIPMDNFTKTSTTSQACPRGSPKAANLHPADRRQD
jgi:Sulfotransferase family